MGRATQGVRVGGRRITFQPTPSSYGEGDIAKARDALIFVGFQPTPSSYGEGDSRRARRPPGPGCFNPRPPLMGRATLVLEGRDVDLEQVSTHALLLWGGRRRPRCRCTAGADRFNPRPPLMGRATTAPPAGGPEARSFQPTPSSYGEGDGAGG